MKTNPVLSLVALLSLGLASAALAKETVLPPVGPEPPGIFHGPLVGFLKVYTATNEVSDGDMKFYPHTGYKVCAPNGKVVAFVANGDGHREGAPDNVELPPGKYVVHAESDRDGRVAVPVVIRGGNTTVVDLESEHVGGERISVAANRAVTSPAGMTVGWKAGSADDPDPNWNQ